MCDLLTFLEITGEEVTLFSSTLFGWTTLMRITLNERAESLPASIVTAIITSVILLTVGAIIATVTGIVRLAGETTDENLPHQRMVTEFTDDAETSFLITPGSDNRVTFSGLTEEGYCSEIVWTQQNNSVERSFTLYREPQTDWTGCDENSEQIVKPATKAIVKDSADFIISYRNNLGREMTADGSQFSDSTEVAPDETKNVQEAWNDLQVSTVHLTYSFNIRSEETPTSPQQFLVVKKPVK